jgi:SAM-dependent methyltransferase
MAERYGFGKNWAEFIEKNFSDERRRVAKDRLLTFLGRPNLTGVSFLDIGSGSGLHSMAALDAGAARVRSFDYDPMSVSTTAHLHEIAGSPERWTVERGDVLDQNYVDGLGQFDIVYSWGVLHHTGSMWQAIDNAAGRVMRGGLFFIALYSSNVASPSTEFWLDVKERYNDADDRQKRRMELWYVWRFGLNRNPFRLPLLLKQIYEKKKQRGMNYMTDVKDWLGGWPMEYADDEKVVSVMEAKHGFKVVRMARGEACTEFLFERPAAPEN